MFACIGSARADTTQTKGQADVAEFVQITIMRLQAGEKVFEAFRIQQDGTAEWAKWNSSGHLINHTAPFNTGAVVYDGIVSSSSYLNPPEPSQYGSVLGRPAFRLDIATFSGSGVKAVSMNKMPDDITEYIQKIMQGVKPTSLRSGWYVWTQPYPGRDQPDIDMTTENRHSTLVATLWKGIRVGGLIIRSDNTILPFMTRERAKRIAFVSRFPTGNLLFGVLSAKQQINK